LNATNDTCILRNVGIKEAERFYIGEKLNTLLKSRGISQRQLARMTGYTQQYINAVARNKTSVSIRALKKIAEALGVSPSYFLEDYESLSFINNKELKDEVIAREYVMIPVITGVGAGGEIITRDHVLIRRGQVPVKTVVAFEVKGDSMEPTIPSQSIVLVDREDRELQEGKVYLFVRTNGNDENGLLIRRVYKGDKGWMLVPDNRRYPPEDAAGYSVVGRVLYKLPPIKLERVE